MIDLHTHTTASDGSYSPSEVVETAIKIGLEAVAVTDHDTIEGLPEALKIGEKHGFEVVPGVEISAEFKPGTMHILGYLVDYKDPEFLGKMNVLQEARRQRNPKIIKKLNELGIPITMEQVEKEAGGGQVGRPHFASVMVANGWVDNHNQAFNQFLAKGAPAYEGKYRMDPHDAIQMILQAGGVPVLAHPFSLNMESEDQLADLLKDLTEAGLAGLEVYYPEHTREMSESYLRLVRTLGLCPTGGTDFHGASKPQIKLGKGFGNLAVEYGILEGLKQRKAK